MRQRLYTFPRYLWRLICTAMLVIAGIALGKSFQYSAVEYLGTRIGFDLASFVGLAPFIAILFVLDRQWRQRSSHRRKGK